VRNRSDFFKQHGFEEVMLRNGKNGKAEALFIKMMPATTRVKKRRMSSSSVPAVQVQKQKLREPTPERATTCQQEVENSPKETHASKRPANTPLLPWPVAFSSRTSRPARNEILKIQMGDRQIRQIQVGIKTVDGRIPSGQFKDVYVGQRVRFVCKDPQLHAVCKITGLELYKSIDEMFKREGYRKCIPSAKSINEAIGIFYNIPDYIQRSKQSGVVAIHFERMR
jgi:ASC-1-like (ASCH) protein